MGLSFGGFVPLILLQLARDQHFHCLGTCLVLRLPAVAPYFNGKGQPMTHPVTQPPKSPQDRIKAAAKRALAEAEDRRKVEKDHEMTLELGGRDGPEPTRFGDWEKKGITSDF